MCDDGNINNGDGCSSKCIVEPGYLCNSAALSVSILSCGNGVVTFGEQCDDGGTVADEGMHRLQYGFCAPTMCVRRFVVMGFVMWVSSHWGQVALTADKCTIIPNICCDGIKK